MCKMTSVAGKPIFFCTSSLAFPVVSLSRFVIHEEEPFCLVRFSRQKLYVTISVSVQWYPHKTIFLHGLSYSLALLVIHGPWTSHEIMLPPFTPKFLDFRQLSKSVLPPTFLDFSKKEPQCLKISKNGERPNSCCR